MEAHKLNIGSSQTRIEGFVNVDIASGADLQIDLDTTPLPFPDGSVECIYCSHTLEHFENYLFALEEMWRVLQHGGQFFVSVPYVTLTEFNLVNTYHKTHFREYSFDFFDTAKLKRSASENNPICFTKAWHRFNYLPGFSRLPAPLRTFCRRHMFNVVRSIDFALLAVKPPHRFIAVAASAAAALEKEFDAVTAARVPVTGRGA